LCSLHITTTCVVFILLYTHNDDDDDYGSDYGSDDDDQVIVSGELLELFHEFRGHYSSSCIDSNLHTTDLFIDILHELQMRNK